MTPPTSNGTHPSAPTTAGILLRGWRTIAAVAGASILLTGVLVALLPPTYTATTVLVPASYDVGASARAGMLAAAQLPAGLGGLVGGTDPQVQLILSVLKSRALRESVVRAEGNRTPRAELQQILKDRVSVDRRTEDGSITVSVTAPTREQAARIANHFPEAINGLVGRMVAQAASRKQSFLEAQVSDARTQLSSSEERMLAFQQNRGISEPAEQATRTVEAAARIQQAISQKELEIGRLRRSATEQNPQLRAAIADLNALRGQMERLTNDRGNPIFVPIREGAALRVESVRMGREFKEREQVYVALAGALAQARLQANNTLPVLSVLDPAIPPNSPSRSVPKLLVVAAVLGTLIGGGIVIALERLRRATHPAAEPVLPGNRVTARV